MICRLCLNTLDEQNAILLFSTTDTETNERDNNKTIPENYLVQLISTHLYLCLSPDDAISTCICSDCCAQLESFHNFWKLVEHKQTTLCSQFLEIDCDVNWSEEGDIEQQTTAIVDYEQEPDPDLEAEAGGDEIPTGYDALVREETEFHESYLKTDLKAAATHKFPCMFCDKSFKMRRYLEEHVATHTGDRPIACAYCNTAFRCRSNMYTHVKTKHTTQWKKARAERESAKINSNNNIQNQRSVNGDNDKFLDAITVPISELETSKQHLKLSAPLAVMLPASPPVVASAIVSAIPPSAPAPAPAVVPPPSIDIKSEPMEAINLTVSKTCLTPPKRVTRASRRKTHSPKKVQHNAHSHSASEDSSNEDVVDVHGKRVKTELQKSKENELMLANYNAVAAVVAAATQQQHLRTTIVQHQELLTAMAAVSSSTSTAASVTVTSQASIKASGATGPVNMSVPALPAPELYTCNICGQQLRNQRALNNHLHNKHNAMPTSPLATSSTSQALPICASCGELAGHNHRCLSKAKYACDVCGKSFKMKRYLEEHFATHTGVKLHTCAFCPTEFRSKSNMYHHTKRKHKIEWERSRASRVAAKSSVSDQQPHPQQHDRDPQEIKGEPNRNS